MGEVAGEEGIGEGYEYTMQLLNSRLTTNFRELKLVLIDLSGTLHIENQRIPGAVEALKRLRESGLGVKFVTNTTKESRRFLFERLTKLGFVLSEDEIFTSLWSARELIMKESLRPILMVDERAMEDFEGVSKFEGKPNAVVMGLAPSKFGRENMNSCLRALLEGARLVAINMSRYYRREDGLALGTGPFVRALEYATNSQALVVGKPCSQFFASALDDVPPDQAIMIGDDVRDDIEGAFKAGIGGILVQTGKYRPGDEKTAEISLPSFPDAVEAILSARANA